MASDYDEQARMLIGMARRAGTVGDYDDALAAIAKALRDAYRSGWNAAVEAGERECVAEVGWYDDEEDDDIYW